MDNQKETLRKDINQERIERLKPYAFTAENQPKNRGRKKGASPTDWLKKLSRTKIDFQNPLTGKVEKGQVALIVAIKLVLKATQDDDLGAIKEIIDRLDGKLPTMAIDQSRHLHITYGYRTANSPLRAEGRAGLPAEPDTTESP